MKFIDLTKMDNTRNETYQKFDEEITGFKSKYDDKFDLNYYSKDYLTVTFNNPRDYTNAIHDDLMSTFDVRLIYVRKGIVQSVKGIESEIEFIYAPVHHYTRVLEWDDISL